MKHSLIIALSLLACMSAGLVATAQPGIREDDHFWRRRIVNRISLVEKINQPLVRHESNYYSENGRYTHTDGMIMALIDGMKAGKIVAYDPDSWDKTYTYEELVARMRDFESAVQPVSEDGWGSEAGLEEAEATTLDQGWNEESAVEWNVGQDSEWGTPFDQAPGSSAVSPLQTFPEIAPYEQVLHVVEDYIFDKNTSRLQQRIDFFEVIWVDPGETLPEKVLARFRWVEVREVLDETMWKSRFNDAEARSVAEVFDLRIFHAFPIQVGGHPVRTLMEAERRRQEMVEYESHLWNY